MSQTLWNETNPTVLDVYERAWGIIANASGGNWDKESPEWREAAAAFNRAYIKAIRAASPSSTPGSETPSEPRRMISDRDREERNEIAELSRECDCRACKEKRNLGYAVTACCPLGLTHSALCACGGSTSVRPPSEVTRNA